MAGSPTFFCQTALALLHLQRFFPTIKVHILSWSEPKNTASACDSDSDIHKYPFLFSAEREKEREGKKESKKEREGGGAKKKSKKPRSTSKNSDRSSSFHVCLVCVFHILFSFSVFIFCRPSPCFFESAGSFDVCIARIDVSGITWSFPAFLSSPARGHYAFHCFCRCGRGVAVERRGVRVL